MKKFALLLGAVVSVCLLSSGSARADWGKLGYSGYQPWYNVFAKRNKCLSPEEERLQKFWHDYYNAMKHYYDALDNIDWVAYYKNHGYQINAQCGTMGGCGQRINYAPVFVSPRMEWASPGSCMGAPPSVGGGGGGAGCMMPMYGYGFGQQ